LSSPLVKFNSLWHNILKSVPNKSEVIPHHITKVVLLQHTNNTTKLSLCMHATQTT